MNGLQDPENVTPQEREPSGTAGNASVMEKKELARCESAAGHYGRAFRVLLIILLIFAVLSLLFNGELLNFKNMYLFAHDLSASYDATFEGVRDVLTYTANDDSLMLAFRGGLAVVGNRNVALFTSTGRQTLSDDLHLNHPAAVASDKYLLVWDANGTTLRLYNAYTCVYSETTAYPIQNAYLAKDGHFAVVTRSAEATSVVYLFQNDQKIQTKISRTDYVTCCTLRENGKRAAFLSVRAENGSFISTVGVCRPGDDELRFSNELENTVAYSCSYSARGFLFVLTDGGIRVYNRRGKEKRSIDVDVGSIVSLDAGQYAYAYLAKNEAGETTLTVLNARGRQLRVSGIRDGETAPEQVAVFGKYVFLREAEGVRRIPLSGSGQEFIPCETIGQTLVVCDENDFMLCTSAKAIHYTIQ